MPLLHEPLPLIAPRAQEFRLLVHDTCCELLAILVLLRRLLPCEVVKDNHALPLNSSPVLLICACSLALPRLKCRELLAQHVNLRALFGLCFTIAHHLFQLFKFFCLLCKLRFFPVINFALQHNQVVLELLKLFSEVFALGKRLLGFPPQLSALHLLGSEFVAQDGNGTVFNFTFERKKLLVRSLQAGLGVDQLLAQAFFVELKPVPLFFKLGFDRENFFLFLSKLARHFLNFVPQLLLQLEDALLPPLQILSLLPQFPFETRHLKQRVVKSLVPLQFFPPPVASNFFNFL